MKFCHIGEITLQFQILQAFFYESSLCLKEEKQGNVESCMLHLGSGSKWGHDLVPKVATKSSLIWWFVY
jgi:hypothetical protein